MATSTPAGSAGHAGTATLPTKVYVGRLPSGYPRKELEDLFAKYGRVLSCEIKMGGFAFIEFEDNRDAEDAIGALNNYPLDGERITVEWSRKSSATSSSCFICGTTGHWARECPENKEQGLDVKSGKCFKCGEHGHLARECRGAGRGVGRGGRSRSRSRSPRRDYRDHRRRSPSRDRGRYEDYHRRSPDRRHYRYDDRDSRYGAPPPRDDYYDRRRSPPPHQSRYDDRYAYDAPPPPRGGGIGVVGGPGGRYDDYPPPHGLPPRDYYGAPMAGVGVGGVAPGGGGAIPPGPPYAGAERSPMPYGVGAPINAGDVRDYR